MTISMPMDFVGYLVVAEIAAVAAVIAVVAPLVWAVDRLNARRKRIVREREGRRDGYVTDGDTAQQASQETQDFFALLDENDRNRNRNRDRDRWAS